MDVIAIRDALETLRRIDVDLKIFGAAVHEWRLNLPASITQVVDFEAKRGVALPADYRQFLLEVGNGGAGPFYGLYPLGGFDSDVSIGDLSRPFPHTEAWNMRLDCAAEEVGLYELEQEYADNKWIAGAIPICHEGCGYYDFLVVTGPERGNMWIDGRVSDQGISPICKNRGNAGRQTFLEWYMDWLNEAIHKCKVR